MASGLQSLFKPRRTPRSDASPLGWPCCGVLRICAPGGRHADGLGDQDWCHGWPAALVVRAVPVPSNDRPQADRTRSPASHGSASLGVHHVQARAKPNLPSHSEEPAPALAPAPPRLGRHRRDGPLPPHDCGHHTEQRRARGAARRRTQPPPPQRTQLRTRNTRQALCFKASIRQPVGGLVARVVHVA